MKNTSVPLLAFILSTSIHQLQAQEYYYWANDKKVALELLPEKNFIVTTTPSQDKLTQSMAISTADITVFRQLEITKSIENSGRTSDKQDILYWALVNLLINHQNIQSSEVVYTAPFFIANGKEVGLSHFFYVKLREQADYVILEKLALENSVKIEGRSKFMPHWYILSCTNKSAGNALEMANLFYETGLFSS